jgi:hypothetical protein
VLKDQINAEPNIWQLYLYSLKSSQTRKNYQGRIDKFFDFVGVEGKTPREKFEVYRKSKIGEKQMGFQFSNEFYTMSG